MKLILFIRAGTVGVGALAVVGAAVFLAAPAHADRYYSEDRAYTCIQRDVGGIVEGVEAVATKAMDRCHQDLDRQAVQAHRDYTRGRSPKEVRYSCDGALVSSVVLDGGSRGLIRVEAVGGQRCTYFFKEG